jgi:hypothetical protein
MERLLGRLSSHRGDGRCALAMATARRSGIERLWRRSGARHVEARPEEVWNPPMGAGKAPGIQPTRHGARVAWG